MTAARLAWLEELARGPAARHRGPTGSHCMRLKWVEWNYRDRDTGATVTEAEAKARWGARWWDHCRIGGERLTQLGWQVLRQHRERLAQIDRLGDERRPPPIKLWKAGNGDGD
jgi:hypothetical protein